MPSKLKDIDISLISIVDKGANLKEFVIKNFGFKVPSFERNVSIAKVDEEKRIIYGIVYSPDEIDAHEDYSTADEIEKAAHNFLRKSKTNAVDTQHNLVIAKGCTIVESAIIKGSHEYFPNEKDGSWYVAIKVDNDEIWKGIKDGTYTGLSMYGFAKKEDDITKSEDALFDRVMKRLIKAFGGDVELTEAEQLIKDFNARYSKMDHFTIIDALSSANYDVMWNDTVSLEDKAGVMIENLMQAKARLESIEVDVVKGIIAKAGKTISAANLKKIQTAYDALGEIITLAETVTEKREKFIKQFKNSTNMENVKKEDHDKVVKEKDDRIAKLEADIEALKKQSKGSEQIIDPVEPAGEVEKKTVIKFV